MPPSSSRLYVGIDPGASGGIAFVSFLNGRVKAQSLEAMPKTERDVADLFSPGIVLACIESVHAMPQQGVSSSFTFGRNYGFLRGCLIALHLPFQEVTPRMWQKALGVTPKGKEESKTEFKNRLKAMAQQRFPEERITLATADAVLIALYCCLRAEGKL